MSETLGVAVVEIGVAGAEKVKAAFSGLQNTAKGALSSISSGFRSMGVGLGTLGIVAGIGATISMAVKRAMDAEQVTQNLKSALAATGQEVENNCASFKKLAADIQQVTNQSKSETMALIETGIKMNLSAKQAEQYALTATGLAKRTGMGVEEAMTNLVKLGNKGMRNTFDRIVPAIAGASTQADKLAAASKLAKEGMQMLSEDTDTTSGRFTSLTQAVGSLYTQFGEMLLPVVGSVVNALKGFFDWIQQIVTALKIYGDASAIWTVSAQQMSMFGVTGGGVLKSIKEWVEAIIMVFMNWDLTAKTVGISIAMSIVNIAERIMWFAEQIPIALVWVWNNFKDIFTTIYSFVASVFTGICTNIMRLWDALMGWFKGKGFHFEWKGLLDDFQSTIKEAPAFTKFVHSDLYNGLASQMGEVEKEWDARTKRMGEAMKKAEKPAKAAVEKKLEIDIGKGLEAQQNTKADKAKKGKDGGQITDLISIWKNLQGAGMKTQAEKLQKEQKDLQAKQLKEAKRLNDNFEKHFDASKVSFV